MHTGYTFPILVVCYNLFICSSPRLKNIISSVISFGFVKLGPMARRKNIIDSYLTLSLKSTFSSCPDWRVLDILEVFSDHDFHSSVCIFVAQEHVGGYPRPGHLIALSEPRKHSTRNPV